MRSSGRSQQRGSRALVLVLMVVLQIDRYLYVS
jgi:hypothetical protein